MVSSLRRSKGREKRTKTGLNLVRMILGGYLECDARVDTQEKTEGKGKKEKKEERKTKRCLHSEQTVATGGNTTGLLMWEYVLERRIFVSKRNAVSVETIGIRHGPLREE